MNTNEKFLQSLLDKLDQVSGTQNQMLVEIAEIKRDIAYHIKRTDLAEENLKLVREDIKPVKKHVAMMEGGLKLLGIISLVIGIVISVTKLI